MVFLSPQQNPGWDRDWNSLYPCNIPQPNMAHGPQEECKAFQLIVEEGIAARTDLDLGQALPQVPWDIGKAPLSLFPALSRNFQLRQISISKHVF